MVFHLNLDLLLEIHKNMMMDRFDKSRMLEKPNAHDYVFSCTIGIGICSILHRLNKNGHVIFMCVILKYWRPFNYSKIVNVFSILRKGHTKAILAIHFCSTKAKEKNGKDASHEM